MPEVEENTIYHKALEACFQHPVKYGWLPRRIYTYFGNSYDEGGIAHILINGSPLCATKIDYRYVIKDEHDDTVKRTCKMCERRAIKFMNACQVLDSIEGM